MANRETAPLLGCEREGMFPLVPPYLEPEVVEVKQAMVEERGAEDQEEAEELEEERDEQGRARCSERPQFLSSVIDSSC